MAKQIPTHVGDVLISADDPVVCRFMRLDVCPRTASRILRNEAHVKYETDYAAAVTQANSSRRARTKGCSFGIIDTGAWHEMFKTDRLPPNPNLDRVRNLSLHRIDSKGEDLR